MARQVLPLIDLRSQAERQGITRSQQTAQTIANIFKIAGAAEQKRRERQTLDRITRAIAGGATTIEAISAVAGQGPEFSTGIPGALQKFGGMFQPSPGGMGQDIQRAIIGQKIQQALDPFAKKQARASLRLTRARTKEIKAPRPATLSPIMKMVQEGLITQAEGMKLARKDADNDLGEKDFISLMHTLERALAATYDAVGSPLPGREDQRKYYVEQLEHYESRLDTARKGKAEGLPKGVLEVKRTPPTAPRPYLNRYWGDLDDETKSLVTRAITQGSTQKEILAALRARGAIK